MPDRITPREGMVIQYFRGTGTSEKPLAARIDRVISATEADITFYEDGEEKKANGVPLGHALDSSPSNRDYAKFPPRPDVASERHLLHPDRAATEGSPQRGESADPRVPPTVEHVSEEDSTAHGAKDLPSEKAGGIPKAKSKSEEKRHAARQPDPSLRRK